MFIVKVPGVNNPNGNTKGCERAGNAILQTLKKEIHSNESGKEIEFSSLDLEEIHLDNSNLKLTNKLIYENAFETFELKPKVIFLGGDHSISYSLARAFFDYCQNSNPVKEPCLIIFDSCPNLKVSGKTNEKQEHPTNEEWLRKLILDGFPAKNIMLVGNRNFKPDESEFIKKNHLRTISLNQILLDLEDTADTIMEFSNNKELYVSVDMSVIDPVFAPAANYIKNTAGLSSREFIYIIQRLNRIKRLRAIDIVEINEQEDKNHNNLTIQLGAKILSEIL